MKIVSLCLWAGVSSVSMAADIPMLEMYYAQGRASRLANQPQEAINNWVKYLELARRLDPPGQKIKEVSALIDEVKAMLPSPKTEILIPVDPTDKPMPVSSPRVRTKDKKLTARLLEKAEKAEYSGRYEESRRLIALALQNEPENENLQKKARELDRMME